ncbi:hypothetical protein C8R45DRAFT_940972 [Mycena sanguinolenta]|nr:hypothetical protein C8R45DRAFT_940972 [Mycena sanguinolenta]
MSTTQLDQHSHCDFTLVDWGGYVMDIAPFSQRSTHSLFSHSYFILLVTFVYINRGYWLQYTLLLPPRNIAFASTQLAALQPRTTAKSSLKLRANGVTSVQALRNCSRGSKEPTHSRHSGFTPDPLQQVVGRLCTFANVFTTAPNLHHVTLPRIPVHTAYQILIPLPWQQITQYHGDCHFEQQLYVLQAAPNLTSCTLTVGDADDPDRNPSPQPTVMLPHLRRLSLDEESCCLPIVAPNLEELSSACSPTGVKQIIPFVHRASCTLQKLALWDCRLNSQLISTLRDLPSLTYLLIHNDHHTKSQGVAFFTAMSLSGTSADICPRLTSIVYGYTNMGWKSKASRDSFAHMARSRFAANARLPGTNFMSLRLLPSTYDLKRYVPPQAKIKARVQALQDDGLDVAFLSEGETMEYLRSNYI